MGAVKNELDEAARYFVLYDDEQRRPKRKVILYADADKRLDYVVDILLVVFPPLAAHEVLDGLGGKQLLYELIIHHLHRQPHHWRGRHVLDFDLDALADGTLAGDGVERSGDCGKAAVVFLEDGIQFIIHNSQLAYADFQFIIGRTVSAGIIGRMRRGLRRQRSSIGGEGC